MVPDCAPAAVSGYPQAKRSGGDGAERKVRRTILLAVPPVEHTTQWGRCSKKWEGVDMQGRKRCCPEDPGHPRPQAGTRKRSAAGGDGAERKVRRTILLAAAQLPQTGYHKPSTNNRLPQTINQQPTTPNQQPSINYPKPTTTSTGSHHRQTTSRQP